MMQISTRPLISSHSTGKDRTRRRKLSQKNDQRSLKGDLSSGFWFHLGRERESGLSFSRRKFNTECHSENLRGMLIDCSYFSSVAEGR
jgi:hypothetical protein